MRATARARWSAFRCGSTLREPSPERPAFSCCLGGWSLSFGGNDCGRSFAMRELQAKEERPSVSEFLRMA
jgi:hypothetical protein